MCTYLHNEEVWIVDIQLDRSEEVLYSWGRGIAPIDKIFVPSSNHNLVWRHMFKNFKHLANLSEVQRHHREYLNHTTIMDSNLFAQRICYVYNQQVINKLFVQ